MIPRTLTTTAVVAAAFAVAASGAWGKSVPYHDHGDATKAQAALQMEPSLVIVHDHGDAAQARLALQSSSIEVVHDHGDATEARLTLQSAPVVARERSQRTAILHDHGDATQARLDRQSAAALSAGQLGSTSEWNLDWAELGIGFGLGMLLVLGVALAVRVARGYRLAH